MVLPEDLQKHLQNILQKTLPDARIEVASFPELNGLRLGLINSDYQTGPLPPDVMNAVIANPAYWAFCWGSGLALAQWLLENPATVQHKKVIDLGSGSGVVAIAAAMAGAHTVYACDNDPNALAATRVNAALNNIDLRGVDDLTTLPTYSDTLFMADVLYDRSNFALIEQAKKFCDTLIIADSRINDVDDNTFEFTHTRTALTQPNLGEFEEFRTVRFFQWTRLEKGTL